MNDPITRDPSLLAYFAQPIWALWVGRVLQTRSRVNTMAGALQ